MHKAAAVSALWVGIAPPEIQSKGIALAENAETVRSFIQPLTPEHNKNVWENCAVIIAEKSDEKLEP